MYPAQSTISPRGIPPIRTDWLADVAARLAESGLDALRRGERAGARLTDTVDGESWRFAGDRFSEPWETAVEFDTDLFLPSDGERATLRAGFALAPRWDTEHGLVKQIRIEIGPRGAVTFDPENWMFTLPVGLPRPAVAGVGPGRWEVTPGGHETTLGTLDDLVGLDLSLDELMEVSDGEAVPQLRLPGYRPAAKPGLLARLTGRAKRASAPVAALALCSHGPITVAFEGGADADSERLQCVASVRTDDDGIRIEGAGGAVLLRGTDLRHQVPRFGAADGDR